jgi:hypothetical protein
VLQSECAVLRRCRQKAVVTINVIFHPPFFPLRRGVCPRVLYSFFHVSFPTSHSASHGPEIFSKINVYEAHCINIHYGTAYLPIHLNTRFGLLTNRNITWFKQLYRPIRKEKASLGVSVNIIYHILLLLLTSKIQCR